jgi:Ca2+-binding EF-hand superfamily protein
MKVADKDGNGELDFGEFEEFFSRIEGIYVSDEVIRQIFDSYDTSGDGVLSVDEFANSIYKAVIG